MTAVRLDDPHPADAEEFLAAVGRSRALHGSWVSPPDTVDAYRNYLHRAASDRERIWLVRTEDGDLVGVVNLSEIVRGVFFSAYLAYYAFVPFAGRGLMKRGLALAVSRAFREEKLHRLEANLQPGNHASRALVQALGFEQEGYSPRYLKIGGRWRDHERWAIRRENWKPPR